MLTLSGLTYSPHSERGALFYMLGALSEHGRAGLLAVGNSPEEAEQVFHSTVRTVDEGSTRRAGARDPRLDAEAKIPKLHLDRGPTSLTGRSRGNKVLPMTGDATPIPASRLLGSYTAGLEGPTVVLIGGMHGNEPAGTQAIPRVLGQLASRHVPLRGRVIGLAGNLAALAVGRRYLDRDLNRGWTREDVAALLGRGSAHGPAEDIEQRQLLATLAPLLAEAREPLVFLDLHSTSGDSPPFTVMADVIRNRTVGLSFPLPVILGIEEILDGTLLGYFCDLGHVAVAVEGGQSQDPRTVVNHEAAIWTTLTAAGSLPAAAVPEREAHHHRLREAARGLPPVVEIRHRHLVGADDGFRMAPGWASFQPVRRGQVVAEDRNGPVRCPEDGLMLMPRYQAQGEDGYFLVRRVSRFWLRLSALFRRARLDRLVPLLPGVRRHAVRLDSFLVDPRVARWQVVNAFHLFGYRRVREAGDRLVFSRRRPGFQRLDRLPPELQSLAQTSPPSRTS